MRVIRFLVIGLLGVLPMTGFAAELVAQSASTPAPTLQAYTHIFLAYAAAWLWLLIWVLRIAAKLKQASRG